MLGHLYLAGCGPYDENFVTSALIEHIQLADVILYDRLINKDLLKYAKKSAIVTYVGKELGEQLHTQDYIHSQILSYLKQDKTVVRLKSGDPFLFGRGFEEYQIAKQHAFPVTVIPGLSSALSVPSTIGLPLTLRNVSYGVSILTGTDADQNTPQHSFSSMKHSYVFLMSVKHFDVISKHMINAGFDHTQEAIAISNGTYSNQQIVCGTITNIHEKMRAYNQQNPALIIVSPTIAYWKKYYTPRILSTKIDGSDFEDFDTTFNIKSVHIPLLSHKPLPLSEDAATKLKASETLVLSSPITARYTQSLQIPLHAKQIVAIGPKTKQMADQYFSNVLFDKQITTLTEYIHQQITLENTAILTSNIGKDIRIDNTYSQNIIPIFSLNKINTKIPHTPFDAITVYSPSSLSALTEQIQQQSLEPLFSIPLFCFGTHVYEEALNSPFQYPICIKTNKHNVFYQAIQNYFKERYAL